MSVAAAAGSQGEDMNRPIGLSDRRPLALLLAGALAVGLLALGAPAAVGAPPGANLRGTGSQPPGQGLGSKAALAQASCDPTTGRTSFVYVGSGPWCVNPWPDGKNNGGATAPGVTATTVKVVVYIPNEQMLAAGSGAAGGGRPMNQATKQPATPEEAIKDFEAVYEYAASHSHTYELWGRKPVFDFVTASGTDETAQRADAVEVLAMKPFIVMDGSNFTLGADVFSTAIAAGKTIVWSASTDAKNAAAQAPYRWSGGQDTDAGPYVVASFLGQSLAGTKARYAGDKSMTTKTRAFGAVYPQAGVDIAAFQQRLKDNGGPRLTQSLQYDSTDSSTLEQQAPTLITKLKDAGVTTVVLFTDGPMMRALMAAATNQEYRPEWILTGFAFQDFDGFGRVVDQSQMAHAFGTGVLPPSYDGGTAPGPAGVFPWYWGTNQGTTSSTLGITVANAYVMIHYAGPKLTAKNVEKGLFSAPATGGASDGTTYFQTGFGKTVGLPYDEHSTLGTDRTLAWWNPDLTGPANAVASLVGKGKLMYLNGAKRYKYAEFPTKEPKFFDASTSVASVPISTAFVNNVAPVANPCSDCPVNGGSGTASG
jgi:hypothetical protein